MIGPKIDKRAVEGMKERAENLRLQRIDLTQQLDQYELLLDEVSDPVISQFLKRWSERETSRLAKIGMKLDVDDRDGRLILSGQYNEAGLLGSTFEDIQKSIDETAREIHAIDVDLADLNTKINKAKE